MSPDDLSSVKILAQAPAFSWRRRVLRAAVWRLWNRSREERLVGMAIPYGGVAVISRVARSSENVPRRWSIAAWVSAGRSSKGLSLARRLGFGSHFAFDSDVWLGLSVPA